MIIPLSFHNWFDHICFSTATTATVQTQFPRISFHVLFAARAHEKFNIVLFSAAVPKTVKHSAAVLRYRVIGVTTIVLIWTFL